ncbi:MAG TPA: glycosyltransferase family 2 protein [Bryobacteraceae bacterium]|nr:glycosyltransferase family 2 protein [Bryobacteraceae bacterium]HOQ45931.1 glycosyltransferase family 2 protein [Bryobacteraceae bacterium]HPU73250.1 glycosyltransferase family 2 protein [Bryobacteraceae bacterium]
MSGITVIIPHWNRCDLIGPLLDRLQGQTCPIQEILVIDNGSTDKSVEVAKAKGARVIELEQNVGFAAAVNRGVREARTDMIAILNNDVDPQPDWLEQLQKALAEPRVFFATGKLVDASRPDIVDGTYDTLSRGACAWRVGHGRHDGPLWSRRRRIRMAPMTATLFRAELFRRVGLLDERFGSYLEDVDFGLRCAMLGCFGMYVPEAVARHAGSATLGAWHSETVRRIARNQVLLVAKHYPLRYLFRYGWPILLGQILWGGVALRHGRGLAYLAGKIEGLMLFRRIRREVARGGGWPRGLSKIIEHSESEIYHLQRTAGFDPYWRLYFALTSLT